MRKATPATTSNRKPGTFRARWPRRWVYPLAGAPLAVGALTGLVVLQALLSHTPLGVAAVVQQLRADPQIYAYIFFSTLLITAVLGWVLGGKEDRLEAVSVTDSLTGLANRRRLRAQIVEETNRADRYDTPLALLLIDLDRLKALNDRHGHALGDQALRIVAEALRLSCRNTDLPARHGGDEFAVLAVNTTATEALALAQRILLNVRRLGELHTAEGEFPHDPDLGLSVSIGVADMERAILPGFDGLYVAADQALYRAKDGGRDRAMTAPERMRSSPRLRLVQVDEPPIDIGPTGRSKTPPPSAGHGRA